MITARQKVHTEGNEDLKRLLLEYDDDDHPATQQFTNIHKIVLGLIRGHLKEELERSTATFDEIDVSGTTALSWAATRGDLLSTRLLLSKGASLETAAADGKLPLHKASLAQSGLCLEILAGHAINIDVEDLYGNTALHYVVKNAVQSKARMDQVKLCIKFLLKSGADPNKQDRAGKTPLRYCVESKNIEAASLFLEAGADIQRPTHDGLAPADAALEYKNCEILRFLLQKGASLKDATAGENFHCPGCSCSNSEGAS